MSDKSNPLAPDCPHCEGTGRGAKGRAYLADCEHCDGTGKVKRDPAIVDKARELTAKITSKAKAAKEKTLQNTERDDADPRVVSPREALFAVVERHGFDLSTHARDVVCTGESFVMILPNDTPEEKRAEVEHDCNAVMPEGIAVFVQRRGGGQSAMVTATPLSPGVIATRSASPPVLCVECGKPVEHARECYGSPTCYACLPPPEPLPVNEPKIPKHEREFISKPLPGSGIGESKPKVEPINLIVECPKCGANDWTCDPLSCVCNACGFNGETTDERVFKPFSHFPTPEPFKARVNPLRAIVGDNLERNDTRREMLAAILDVVPKLSKHEAQALLAKCDRGSQHCSECPAFGCCDNTAIRVREPDDALVAMRERECVGVPVKVRNPITGETSDGERGPVCPLQPGLGSNLSSLVLKATKVDVREILERVIDGATDEMVRAFLVRLGERLDSAERDRDRAERSKREACQTLIAEIGASGPESIESAAARAVERLRSLRGEIDVATIASQDNDPLVRTDDEILSRVIETCDDETVRDGLARIRKSLALARGSSGMWECAARYWWLAYQRANGRKVRRVDERKVLSLDADMTARRRTESDVDPEDDCASQCIEVIAANSAADEWREAIEWALGVEPDPEEHTTEWARELVRAVREIGNKAHVEAETRRRVARKVFDPTKPARLVSMADDDADAKARAGIDPAAPTHDEQGNPLSLGFMRCHFPASDKGEAVKLAAFVGYAGDEWTKRTPGDMSAEELRRAARRSVACPRVLATRSDMKAALASFGLEVVTLDDSDGKVTVHVSGGNPDTLPAIEAELQESMPATLQLSLVPVAPHPYR